MQEEKLWKKAVLKLNINYDSALDALLNLRRKNLVIGKFVNENKPYRWYPKVLNV